MPKLNREMLRQMIAEEIAKTENAEPEAVKVSAAQLRNIIMNEVRLISEQDVDVEVEVDEEDSAQLKVRTIDDVLKTAVEFKGNSNDPYGYAIDDQGVYVISKGGKNLKSAVRLDPRVRKGALAIRTLARANRNNKEVMDLMSSENDFLQVASKTVGKQPMSKSMQMLANALKPAVEKPSLDAYKEFFASLKNPKFKVDDLPEEQRDVLMNLQKSYGEGQLPVSAMEDLLPPMRKLEVDIEELFKRANR